MNSETQAIFQAKRQQMFRQAPIDGYALKRLVEAGLAWLRTHQQIVNTLNVFPVPDGDTGINMVLTMQAAFDEIANSPERNIGKLARAVAHGALMGARGNSGVILSQLWRGVARALDDQETLDGSGLVRAFVEARDTAYKGVVRPIEGTILTVAKDAANAAETALSETDDPILILEQIVAAAAESVERTPDLLIDLRKAGVVDAGGKGLFYILEGMLRFINGQTLDTPAAAVQPLSAMHLDQTLEIIEPGQDYEVVVDFRPAKPLELERFYSELEEMGTSIQVGEGEGMYRVHIHVPTEKRYEPIEYTMSLGTVTKVAIENLMDQMAEVERQAERHVNLSAVEPGQIAVVAVAPGHGLAHVFASLGVAAVVEGGQSMNPSTQDILNGFENLPTNKIIILPNNKNIFLAAESAAQLTVKKVAVIPTSSIPEGLAAMLRLVPDGDFDTVVADMTAAISEVQTGEITTAVRDAEYDGLSVREGQIIAMLNHQLVYSSTDLQDACLKLLDKADAKAYELITLFYGADVQRQEVNRIADAVRMAYPDQEVEVQEGGQPHYQFILSVE
jgi:DAK2 domain fusion protein YloV